MTFAVDVRLVAALFVLAMATQPVLQPAGPGNTALADATIFLALGAAGLRLISTRTRLHLPYAVGAWIMMLGGAWAAYSAVSLSAGLAVVQDGFLLLWAAVIACAVATDAALLRALVYGWVGSGIAWASVLFVATLMGWKTVAGITAANGTRAAMFCGDPNLAGNYLLVALFVVLAARLPRRRMLRYVSVAVLLWGIILTGSNGALLGSALGIGCAVVIGIVRRHGLPQAAAVGLLGAVLAISLAPLMNGSAIRASAADSGMAVVRDSIGRSNDSGYEREQLFAETSRLYLQGNLLGVGPSRTKVTLRSQAAPYVKEAHNDYTATLVERGVLGGVGLIIFLGALAVRLHTIASRDLPDTSTQVVPRPWWLLGVAVALVIASVSYEVLHFRHVWTYFGLVAGLHLAAVQRTPLRKRP